MLYSCSTPNFVKIQQYFHWDNGNLTIFKIAAVRHLHHHHQVARPAVSIAVSTTERHLERSRARSHAELRPRLVGCRSDSMVRSQVRRGRPLRRRQSVGRRLKGTGMILWWISSCDMSEHLGLWELAVFVMWPLSACHSASWCKMSLISDNRLMSYGQKTIFKMAAVAISNSKNFNFLVTWL